MNTIVAAAAESFRGRVRERLLEALPDEISTAGSPPALSAALADSNDPVVITGDDWLASRPFVQVAVEAGVPAIVWLDRWSLASAEKALTAGARAVLAAPPTAAVSPAVSAVRAGLIVTTDAPGPGTMQRMHSPTVPALDESSDADLRISLRPLTNRERQILALIAAGTSNKGIARSLGVSANTVKFHLSAAFEKLNVTRRAEAVAAAIRRGELSL